MAMKPVPIGTDNFEKLIHGDFYYVDKTMLIKELLDMRGEVNLFTRLRRFGKTLNLSMLQCFFEDTLDDEANKRKRELFAGLKIMDQDKAYLEWLTSRPVINLSLKSAKQPDWELAYGCLNVKALTVSEDELPAPYWANTSANSIVKGLVEKADISVKKELEDLLAGGTIEKPIHEDITYDSVYDSEDNLWNFLFFTGYLKQISRRLENVTQYITMAVPNLEVEYIFRNTITSWFREKIKEKDLSVMYQAMQNGDCVVFQRELSKLLQLSISYMDTNESGDSPSPSFGGKYYHGFLFGILGNMNDYVVKSNREGGNGRYDIVIRSLDVSCPPVVLELKVSETYKGLEDACDRALAQIREKEYDSWLPEEGYTEVWNYGISFYRKQCRIKAEHREFL